ncbi:hypothetical protein GCM10007358_04770 [Phocicoccus schoeneichii]|uniref:DUF2877 domain-containing protein n=1 Tax=Phocicoccus schoeneichii TaxID=1812261 RepID=A0A6V7RH20_9BACL|nr:DUF2877 domain-containing protein [Jeotgalicoccus schoeneichii]GGH48888.1 hypothetical protein GCM10007358_04770 [Jeotgalicoccus schoeneichii]CAD2076433.1 hypothetical protein JEOSCH030_01074 [Jeotgalicoccus schoeneichii]
MLYTASVAGSAALHLLKTERELKIHSVFNNGVNLVNKTGTLLFIGTDKNGYFPFGITLDQYSVKEVVTKSKPHDKITINRQEIRHKNYSIMLNQVEEFRPDFDFHLADLNQLRENFKHIDFSSYQNSDFDDLKMKKLLDGLKNYSPELETTLRYFVGRGKGLTPTGDDILSGILYADALDKFIDDRSYSLIERLYNENLTTMVSKAFILLALKEIFSSRVTALQRNPSVETMNALKALGSSSGLDTLYGIYKTLNQE